MGAHHALAPTSTARLGRLAGRGALTASAALALAGAGSGAALAHEGGGPAVLSGHHGSFADDGLLCGLLGGDCSSGSSYSYRSTDADSDDSREAGSDDDADSILERMRDGYGSSSRDDASQRSGAASSSDTSQRADGATSVQDASGARSQSQGQSLDTPPPPGQVRTIKIPG